LQVWPDESTTWKVFDAGVVTTGVRSARELAVPKRYGDWRPEREPYFTERRVRLVLHAAGQCEDRGHDREHDSTESDLEHAPWAQLLLATIARTHVSLVRHRLSPLVSVLRRARARRYSESRVTTLDRSRNKCERFS
jgi:hypothetical protein